MLSLDYWKHKSLPGMIPFLLLVLCTVTTIAAVSASSSVYTQLAIDCGLPRLDPVHSSHVATISRILVCAGLPQKELDTSEALRYYCDPHVLRADLFHMSVLSS